MGHGKSSYPGSGLGGGLDEVTRRVIEGGHGDAVFTGVGVLYLAYSPLGLLYLGRDTLVSLSPNTGWPFNTLFGGLVGVTTTVSTTQGQGRQEALLEFVF